MSDESVAMWNCTSGRVAAGSVRTKMPPWLMPIAIGPLRVSTYCKPIANVRKRERSMSLVVIGLVHRKMTRACR